MPEKRYQQGIRGFVVQHDYPSPAHPDRTLHGWWYGGEHGYPNTWGGLDYSVAVFPSRPAARNAYERSTGRAWGALPGYRIPTVAAAETEYAEQVARRAS